MTASALGRGLDATQLCAADFWRALAPALHVGGSAAAGATTPTQAPERLARRMQRDGYFSDRDAELERLAPLIGEAVERCVGAGLPPVFVWAYDEPWTCFRRLAPVLAQFLGPDYKALPAFWAWRVDPRKGEGGWRAHRDNGRANGALAPDGAPLALTCWIPLNEATPLNGCMYIVPAHRDPYYAKPVIPPGAAPPLEAIRALPGKPGDYFIWNQAVLHWGSASSEFADEPRMSMALEFQRGDIPPLNLPPLASHDPPPFPMRLKLIAQQIRQYTHMYAWSDGLLRLAGYLQTAPLDQFR